MSTTKMISVLAPPGVQLVDVSGPLDVFSEANRQLGKDLYRLEVLGIRGGPVRSSSGVRVIADRPLDSEPRQRPHTLLVAGAPGLDGHRPTPKLVQALRDAVKGVRRYGSVCSGAFLLAETGKLDGRRVTTHWAVADLLAARYPKVSVDRDAIFVRDGRVRTAAGVTAGMDLALSLVNEDVGRDLAMKVASQLVMFFKRPGGQLQFSREGTVTPASRSTFQELQRWIAVHPCEDLSVPNLAKRVGLSARHFARVFRSETGMSPASWVEASRVEAARALLESSGSSPKQVAVKCGFADVNVLRRAFQRQTGVTPSEYSKRFRP